MGRCQTLALEHPLASHQSWPRPQHRSQQWQSHTWLGMKLSDVGPCVCNPALPSLPAPSSPVHNAGGLKVPTSPVGSAHPVALVAVNREQLQPHQLGKG